MRAADARGRVTDLSARARDAAQEAEALQDAPGAAGRQAAQTDTALREAQTTHHAATTALASAERHEAAAMAAARTAEQALYSGARVASAG